jgi:hypothetical protein
MVSPVMPGRPVDGFRLVGSGRIAAGIKDPLAELRTSAQVLWEKKLDSIVKGSRARYARPE